MVLLGSPYYAGRHVQILISNGDGTFVDETATRFSYQPRSELDTSLLGTGIGEGVINLQDWDGDGDLDIIDTQETYGGENFAIYPRITLAINDGDGNFEEVSHDFFPNMMLSYLLKLKLTIRLSHYYRVKTKKHSSCVQLILILKKGLLDRPLLLLH